MQFYLKVLPSFTHAIIWKKWVKLGKTFYQPNPIYNGYKFCKPLLQKSSSITSDCGFSVLLKMYQSWRTSFHSHTETSPNPRKKTHYLAGTAKVANRIAYEFISLVYYIVLYVFTVGLKQCMNFSLHYKLERVNNCASVETMIF